MALKTYHQGGRVAVITGASGGMGRACAQRFGLTQRLVLCDIRKDKIEAEAQSLREAGFDVAAALALDIGDQGAVKELAAQAAKAGPLGALVHTAGLSPALADWEPILRVNLVGTALLLEAFVEKAVRGSVAICIASMAGHMGEREPRLEALFDRPLSPNLIKDLDPFVIAGAKTSGMEPRYAAYSISKRAIIRMVQDRARDWAAKGARIVSISPGLMDTPMGRKEAEVTDSHATLLAMTPAGRWGTPMDIANAAYFLSSEEASFVTGCDLLVDGGIMAVLHATKPMSPG